MTKLFFLSIAGCVIIPSVAFAAAPTDVRAVRVSYADLNITNAEGQKILEQRLRQAARTVCAEDTTSPFADLDTDRCRHHALADARLHMKRAVAYAQSQQSNAVLLASR